ncbi:hypothetical protein, partial [Vibrio vulnificus]|uniref:hypothetical protein n=1 Tax=Vibrio vulnificus TaxID=672 RepID=UPI001268F95E
MDRKVSSFDAQKLQPSISFAHHETNVMTNKCSPLFLVLAGMLTSNMAHASFFDKQDGRFE